MTDPEKPVEVLEEYEVTVDTRDDGWIFFAALLILLAGVFNFLEGLIGLTNDRYRDLSAPVSIAFGLDGWGWIHLIVGAALIAVGLGLLWGKEWAIPGAIAVAGGTAILQMIYITTAPLWSFIVIALCIAAIYGLTVKWRSS